ncbi:Eco29kI family restriction endonuclease [Streptomyces sp. Qhu_M48]|uniref:Eco29kI family restriction endonuclease n=1 Tax=Streptomyces sp. Qhu_M48 TaxID=3435889 RepID=UPI003F50CB61
MTADDPLNQLGILLTELRLRSGWNVNELVVRCTPLGRTVISNALNARKGRKVPSAGTVVRICRALGADSAPLLELLRQAKEDHRTPLPGPRAEDRSRQFTREPDEAAEGPVGITGLFNPLRRENLERAVQWALESAPPVSLASFPEAPVDGLYALYYTGPYPLYRPVASSACDVPVYVGMARPGWSSRSQTGRPGVMNRRMRVFERSIEFVDDLEVQDFQVRYLPVEEIWMDGPERLMIGDHRPVWNVVVHGFGTHLQGLSRNSSPRTLWDELHPGRPYAQRQAAAKSSRAELEHAVRQHFARSAEA